MNKKYNFIIVSPHQNTGGAIVLHVLCRELIKRGYSAKIFYKFGVSYKKHKKTFWLRYVIIIFLDFFYMIYAQIFGRLYKTNKFFGYTYKPVKGTKRKYFPFYSKKIQKKTDTLRNRACKNTRFFLKL